MTKHKPKTIKDKGGLKAHVSDMGYSYKLLDLLVRAKTPNTIIATILSVDKDADHKLARNTIKHWKEVWHDEHKLAQREHDEAVEALKRL